MSILNLSIEAQNTILNSFRDLIDRDKKPAYLELLQGLMPNSPESLRKEEDILATIYFTYPSAKSSSHGSLSFTFEKQQIAIKTGKATWARVFSGGGKSLLDLNVGTKNEESTLTLNSTDIVKDGVIVIKAMVFML